MKINERDRKAVVDLVGRRVRVLQIEAEVADLLSEKGVLESSIEADLEGNTILAAAISDLAAARFDASAHEGSSSVQAAVSETPRRRPRGRRSSQSGEDAVSQGAAEPSSVSHDYAGETGEPALDAHLAGLEAGDVPKPQQDEVQSNEEPSFLDDLPGSSSGPDLRVFEDQSLSLVGR